MIVVVRSAPAFFHFMNHIAVESNDVTPKSVNSSRHCFQFLLGLRLPKNDISALQNLQKTMQEWPQLLDNCLASVHLPPAATTSQTPSKWTNFRKSSIGFVKISQQNLHPCGVSIFSCVPAALHCLAAGTIIVGRHCKGNESWSWVPRQPHHPWRHVTTWNFSASISWYGWSKLCTTTVADFLE